MFGCLRRLGCLVVLLVVAGIAWFMQDAWLPQARALLGGRSADTASAATAVTWEPVSDAGADRARRSIEALGRSSGPVFANLAPGDVASYIFVQLSKHLPPSARDIEASVVGDRAYVRASISLADVGPEALGPLASMFSDRETVQFGGTFDVVRPGLAQFVVQEIRIKELALPSAAIPRLLRRVTRGARPEGVADDALPLEIPPHIGDIRVGRGRITLYKNVP